jgi:hypothetical protein
VVVLLLMVVVVVELPIVAEMEEKDQQLYKQS